MAHFLIRVQLSEVDPDHEIYTNLPSELAKKYIYNKMYHPGLLTWHDLPRATYYTGYYGGPGVNTQYILAIVKGVADECIKQFKGKGHEVTIEAHVVVAEATSLATTYPATNPPR